jgi:DNA-binding transcriptional ArsR family regulator
MRESQALLSFAALSQETRMRIVRKLVKAGDSGLASGVLAEAMKTSPANISFHLGQLESAGLVKSRRESRSIIYAADYEALGALIQFLMVDCCSGDRRVLACC